MKLFNTFSGIGNKLQDIALLALRLVLAYGFYEPAMKKVKDVNAIGQWFDSLGIPLPKLNAYLATGTELAGFVLLALGLFTRIISVPLMIVMGVAIFTVHAKNGFAAGENGFEIPLYYLLMLLTLFAFGPGKISLDNLLGKKN